MKVDGGCHCDSIAFEAEIGPDAVGICHCTDCQRLSGTAFRVVVRVPEDKFTLLSGAPRTYVKTAESGAPRAQVFCPECGSQIYATSTGDGRRAEDLEPSHGHLEPARPVEATDADLAPLGARLNRGDRLDTGTRDAIAPGGLGLLPVVRAAVRTLVTEYPGFAESLALHLEVDGTAVPEPCRATNGTLLGRTRCGGPRR